MAEKKVIKMELISGFTVGIGSLPPYYMDLINERFPFLEYPSREISLAGGDIVDWPYEPPETAPIDTDEDYELYIKWHDVHRKRAKVFDERNTARVNYLLNMCVDILDAPIDFEDTDSWKYKIETAFPGFSIPEDLGERRLLFIKHFVITSNEELNSIVASSTSPEVTMQGITSALAGFRNSVENGRAGEDDTEEVEEQPVT